MADEPLLKPGTLWAKIKAQTEHALRCGALQPILTESEWMEQNGIRFLVRLLANLARKDETNKKQQEETASAKEPFNPFLPYDQNLFVADILPTHVGLLNKFNVVEHHLLIVTRAFEHQENLLNLQDFEALWAGMSEFASLGFYNAGKVAGASQRHKHLQLIPLPLAAEGPKLPIEPALAKAHFRNGVGITPSFPFAHALIRLDLAQSTPLESAAQAMLNSYRTLLQAIDLQGGAYNLLVTREWMLVVPRLQECFESISINALGFAGAFLVRNEQQRQILKHSGPMTILKSVAVALKQ